MADPKLLDYVRGQINSGVAVETLKQSLLGAGWSTSAVDEAISVASNPVSPSESGAVSSGGGEVKYAGFWIRWAGAIIDGIILQIGFYIFSFSLGSSGGLGGNSYTLMNVRSVGIIVLSFVAPFIYYIIMTHYYSATLGKMAVGIVVKNETGQKLTLGEVLMREIPGKLLSSITLGIGYLMVAFTEKKQGLHDKLAHSVVVYKDPTKKRTGAFIAVVVVVVLIVLAILGTALAVFFASFNSARGQADNARTISDLRNVEMNMQLVPVTGDLENPYGFSSSCNEGVFAEQASALSSLSSRGKNMKCFSSGKDYAVSIEISNDKTSKTFCTSSRQSIIMGVALIKDGQAQCEEIWEFEPIVESSGGRNGGLMRLIR